MRYDRRTFLKKALAAASVTGASSMGFLRPDIPVRSASYEDPGITTDEERKKLLFEAHFGRKNPAASRKGMVICSHPLATREAVKVLKRGGNACDAALCAAITQTVIEPHMTGITGIFTMLYYDSASGKVTCVDAGWKAPQTPLSKGSPADVRSGRANSVPGWWAGFEEAHTKHASKPIKELMDPAIRYAREGFELFPFLWGEVFAQSHRIGMTQQGREIFMPQNVLPRPWDMLYQKKSADTLERLAAEGGDFFYRGAFAQEHCKAVQEAGSTLSRADFESYQASWLEPQQGTYKGYAIASGGPFFINALSKLEQLDLERLGPPTESSESLYAMLRISNGLGLTKNKERESQKPVYGYGHPHEYDGPIPGSCHITVVDGMGNIAGLLHTSNAFPWTNGLFANGVTICSGGGYLAITKPKPGQKPSAAFSIAAIPNIIFKNKKSVLAIGSPSVSLFANLVQNTVNILDFGIPIEESVNRPRFGGFSYDQRGSFYIEADLDINVRKGAEEKGLKFDVVNPWNWHHGSFEGISIEPDSGLMRACSDPRRCSKAEGI
ncbi:MAG: gamma-glutamyltransferase [Candidatus Aminicenantes bacterium]|nr:gamma-glutamyltransferase [Candidatus Aminicenantes bacterium]